MGIRNLNRLLNDCAPEAIRLISLEHLRGKKIAVDASIYIYKYTATNSLVRDMTAMVGLFQKYKIDPIFVFDGKPPRGKLQTIEERKKTRGLAKKSYNELVQELASTHCKIRQAELNRSMSILRRTMVTVQKEDIVITKNLLTKHCVTYIESTNESDEVCAKMCHTNEVFACLSDDMDMFAYGCSKVIRYLSLVKRTVLIYDLPYILNQLGMTIDEFRRVCVLSGTDYYKGAPSNATMLFKKEDIHQMFSLFKQFQLENEVCQFRRFYAWLGLSNEDIEIVESNANQFDISDKPIAYVKVTRTGQRINVASVRIKSLDLSPPLLCS